MSDNFGSQDFLGVDYQVANLNVTALDDLVILAGRYQDEVRTAVNAVGAADVASSGLRAANPLFDDVEGARTLIAGVVDDMLAAEAQNHVDDIGDVRDLINKGDDLGMSEGELDQVRDILMELDPAARSVVLAALSDTEMHRLLHNVHSRGFWSDDWSDGERREFFDMTAGLSPVVAERMKDHSSYMASMDDVGELYTSSELAAFAAQPGFQKLSAEEREEALDRLAKGDSMTDVANSINEGDGFFGGVWNGVNAVGRFVGGTAENVGKGVWGRYSTFGQYMYDSNLRRSMDPRQTFNDVVTGTAFVETFSAAEAILIEGAEIYKDDADGYCGTEAECLTGALTPKDAITLGHTIRFDSDEPGDALVAHEVQHVYDFESLGGVGFGALYYGEWGARVLTPIDGGYHELWTEQRAYEVMDNYDEGVRPSPEGPVWPGP